jgi:hypothetical protein
MKGPIESGGDGSRTGMADSGDDVRFSIEHRLRKSHPRPSQTTSGARRARRRRRIVRDAVILAVAATLAGLLAPHADVANPDYPEARDIADRITMAWEAITEDGMALDEAAADANLRAFTYEVEGHLRSVLTHREPTATGVCYALRFGPGILTAAGTLHEPTEGCTPQPPGRFDKGQAWSEVLPSERITTWWFLPLMFLISGMALYAVTDMVIELITSEDGKRR